MNHSQRFGCRRATAVCLAVAGLIGASSGLALAAAGTENPIVKEFMGLDGLHWETQARFQSATLVVSGPGGFLWKQSFESGDSLFLDFQSITEDYAPDGQYTYELVFAPRVNLTDRALAVQARSLGQEVDFLARKTIPSLSGTFAVADGVVLDRDLIETTLKDIVHPDDVIVQGSLCVGFDCINNETFNADTIRLKENNLRIHFEDTSTISGFPTNDWRIVINDSNSGGGSFFAVEDAITVRQVFRVDAGAPANALRVTSAGRVGLGTAAPAVNLHIASGNTPTLRLEQNGSSGFTAQTWDVAGNETNFFIRDATNGSKLPFRIQPNAPGNSIFVASTGNVGMGTSSPTNTLDVRGRADIAPPSGTVALKLGGAAGIAFQIDAGNEGVDFWQITSTANDAILRFNRTGGVGNEFEVNQTGNAKLSGSCIEFAGPVACTAAAGSFSCVAGSCP